MPGVPPAPTTAVAGQPTQASNQFNRLAAQVAFILSPPLAILRQTVAQSLPNGSSAVVLFDTEDMDRDGAHSTVTNTGRFTSQTTGWYEVLGHVSFSTNATGRRLVSLRVNGADVAGSASGNGIALSAAGSADVLVGATVFLNATDYLEIVAYQDSGAALNTAVSGPFASRMNIRWVSQ